MHNLSHTVASGYLRHSERTSFSAGAALCLGSRVCSWHLNNLFVSLKLNKPKVCCHAWTHSLKKLSQLFPGLPLQSTISLRALQECREVTFSPQVQLVVIRSLSETEGKIVPARGLRKCVKMFTYCLILVILYQHVHQSVCWHWSYYPCYHRNEWKGKFGNVFMNLKQFLSAQNVFFQRFHSVQRWHLPSESNHR